MRGAGRGGREARLRGQSGEPGLFSGVHYTRRRKWRRPVVTTDTGRPRPHRPRRPRPQGNDYNLCLILSRQSFQRPSAKRREMLRITPSRVWRQGRHAAGRGKRGAGPLHAYDGSKEWKVFAPSDGTGGSASALPQVLKFAS